MKLVVSVLVMMLAGCAARGPRGAVVEPQKLLEFHQNYDRFFRRFFGCPEHATDPRECRGVKYGQVDWKAYEAARNARVF